MASSIGGDFVQDYVLRKLHKEKMERVLMQQEKGNKDGSFSTMKKSGGGFFGLMRKKVHPNGTKSGEVGAPVTGGAV